MLSLKVEQRVNLNILVKLHKTPTECFQMLTTAYGNDGLSRARVFEWHKRVREGCENEFPKVKSVLKGRHFE